MDRTCRRMGSIALAVWSAVVGAAVIPVGDAAASDPASVMAVPDDPGPPQLDHLGAARFLQDHPDAVPVGVNDFGCRPTAAHPRPVILAHGTDATAYADWSVIGPQLVDAGFCVFAPNYGGKPGSSTSFGTQDIYVSAGQIGDFVDRVLAATGADRVELVGFSQGANVTRYYVNKLGGAPKVGQWIGVASPSYGGILYGLVPVAEEHPFIFDLAELASSPAAVQQAQGSPFMNDLNAGGDTVPGVRYTTIGSWVDGIIQPFENQKLRGPGATNLILQDSCRVNLTGHFHMVYDPYVQQLVLNTLDPANAVAPVCVPVALGTGIGETLRAGSGSAQ
ncbi:esterase/lipase family protein [Nocardia sp. NPDC059240]|uniref:esterase/lipase family protein n=1 Tax=Nocardia sp. NPDC059240 TaxID=3346786 RepID=UPI003698A1FE